MAYTDEVENLKSCIERCTMEDSKIDSEKKTHTFYFDSRFGHILRDGDLHESYKHGIHFCAKPIKRVKNILRVDNIFYVSVVMSDNKIEQIDVKFYDFDKSFVIRNHNPILIINAILKNNDAREYLAKKGHPMFDREYVAKYNLAPVPIHHNNNTNNNTTINTNNTNNSSANRIGDMREITSRYISQYRSSQDNALQSAAQQEANRRGMTRRRNPRRVTGTGMQSNTQSSVSYVFDNNGNIVPNLSDDDESVPNLVSILEDPEKDLTPGEKWHLQYLEELKKVKQLNNTSDNTTSSSDPEQNLTSSESWYLNSLKYIKEREEQKKINDAANSTSSTAVSKEDNKYQHIIDAINMGVEPNITYEDNYSEWDSLYEHKDRVQEPTSDTDTNSNSSAFNGILSEDEEKEDMLRNSEGACDEIDGTFDDVNLNALERLDHMNRPSIHNPNIYKTEEQIRRELFAKPNRKDKTDKIPTDITMQKAVATIKDNLRSANNTNNTTSTSTSTNTTTQNDPEWYVSYMKSIHKY